MKSSILKQITELPDLTFAQLKDRWKDLYGTDAPAYNRGYLVKRLAYRIQELAHGGLSQAAKVKLHEGMDGDPLQRLPRRRRKEGMPVPGTRLVREWQGKRYEALILDRGYEFEGRPYRSLSSIAREITGTNWNGPQFFGMRKKNGENRK